MGVPGLPKPLHSAFDGGSAADPGMPGHDGDEDLQNWSSLIGIVTAIVGNVIIALALNVQRYAHIRLHRERNRFRRRAKGAMRRSQNGNNGGVYGTLADGSVQEEENGAHTNGNGETHSLHDESAPLNRSFRSDRSAGSESSVDDGKVASTYLKSPYWWTGQVLITVGELGNFLAYGFAPASIVSPLGVVALISNCIIAPIVFKERFRQRDFWGVVIAVGGVVTVVLSANQQETKLDPHDVWDHITTIEFQVYLALTISLIGILMWASPAYGHRTILIDLGLVGLFGGYTALSTKGVSSMLSSTLLGAFKTPVTYALIFILLFTAAMQVRYLNKALQRFDSTQVIPIQFVSFTLCVIIGSAVLYRDFERTSADQAAKFIGGCLLTFFGVFLITSGRPERDDEEEEDVLSDLDGVEETIGLAEHDQGQPRPSSPGHISGSRRSSKASHISLMPGGPRIHSLSHDSGALSLRRPPTNTSVARSPGAQETEPLLDNPWTGDHDEELLPPPGVRTISSDSIAPFSEFGADNLSDPPTPLSETPPARPLVNRPDPSPLPRPAASLPAQAQRPQSHHFSGPIYSPSPLSSTVSAVMKDTLLRNAENPLLKRPSAKRLRSSIRASLFMSEDELRNHQLIDDAAHSRETERQRLASRSQDHLADMPGGEQGQETLPTSQDPLLDGGRRPRSLSDTLGEIFKVKWKKPRGGPGEGSDE